ncbi:MAG: hypothetical protein WD738_09920 [Pirellulales bacterium]
MKSQICVCFLALLATLGIVNITSAQSNSEFQYEDTFDELDPSWGEPNQTYFVQDGVLVLKLDPGWSSWPINQGMIFEDADISVRTRQVTGKNFMQAVGLIFWAESPENFYVFATNRENAFVVIRRVKDKWLTPVTWRASDALKKGLDEWNELRVVTKGNRATIYINDNEILSLKGQPPAGGSFIGMFAGSPEDEAITYEFDDLRVK